MFGWSQIEPTPPHVAFLTLSAFLITYVLFARLLRNRAHLAEPPIAVTVGIVLGPLCLGWLTPNFCGPRGCRGVEEQGWGWGDSVTQEITRIIVGIQVFAVGVELPRFYMGRHWRSILMLLGPVMTFSWIICAVFARYVFGVAWTTALIASACLTPTDPVLAASILANSTFSSRVPKRLKNMLLAESGCNDGISFPFLYLGIYFLTQDTGGMAIKDWFLITVLWQCVLGTFMGLVIGVCFNQALRFCERKGYVDYSGMTVFYLLLAIFCVGVGSTLGSDDFLVAFGAGYGFARDGWFSKKTKETHLPSSIDLLLNSAMFIYFGTIIPWHKFQPSLIAPSLTPGRLIAFAVLVLLFRRIPIMLASYRWIPDVRTIREAMFVGHIGPMGLGALFLATVARGELENGKETPNPHPPDYGTLFNERDKAIEMVYPIVMFVVLCSTYVHGLSVLGMSLASHFRRKQEDRAPIVGAETEPLNEMDHDHSDVGSQMSESEDEGQVSLA